MGSITPTPTAEKGATYTLAAVRRAAPTAFKMGRITPTPTAEKGAASTLTAA